MKKLLIFLSALTSVVSCIAQTSYVDQKMIDQDLDEIIQDISNSYVFLEDKNVNLDCIESTYRSKINSLKTEEDVILFFEFLLDEFYDNHMMLNTNRSSSYRLFSPFYISKQADSFVLTNVWKTQIKGDYSFLLGAQLKKLNGVDIEQAILNFPTSCQDKADDVVQEWIANKLVAGTYDQPRVLTFKLKDKSTKEIDLDAITLKVDTTQLSQRVINNIGILRINNSLGNDALINEFDDALNSMIGTEGLIIDLRNTVNGGNTYVAKAIMGRFLIEAKPYQQHFLMESSQSDSELYPSIERSWVEYVSPRGVAYTKPIAVLVGRWTGSMGEGLAIGMESACNALVIGTEMERLAGAVYGYGFKNHQFGYRIPSEKLYHINGTPREKYIPTYYQTQSNSSVDQTLNVALNYLKAKQSKSSKTDSVLQAELELLGVKDQTFRKLLPQVIELFGSDSEEYKYIWRQIRREDSTCLAAVISIIDQYGWLGISRIGEEANQAIWLVIQHAEPEVQQKYINLLELSVEKGESQAWHLAFLNDRILMKKGLPQRYGSQAKWNSESSRFEIYKLENREKVNELRKEIGLESIEKYAKQNDYYLPSKNN